MPEFMYVVPPGQNVEPEAYRCAEYSAYYRYVKARLVSVCDDGQNENAYPDPCQHCEVCRWFRECDAGRRADDHFSLVAGITKLQRNQLNGWETETMAKLAILPIPLEQRPSHGSNEGYERVREQARVQVQARTHNVPVYELLPVAENTGFCSLPEPSRLDVFWDLEGDPYAPDGGRQYLFAFVTTDDNRTFPYEMTWCFTAEEEKQAFEWIADEIMCRWAEAHDHSAKQ